MRFQIKTAMAAIAGALIVCTSQAELGNPPDDDLSAFERDRAAILSMAGDFVVTFKFNETLTLVPGAEKSPRDVSRAIEKVFLVEDKGNFISLQHILITGEGDQQRVVKHWRQDWEYENDRILAFRGDNDWAWEDLPTNETKGSWTQSVYQVDDSPRYAGYGKWHHVGDHAYWESSETWRPLPRRERKVRDDYDVLMGRNRQSLTPYGWLHQQDNYKLALHESGNKIIARESGHNTYRRVHDRDFGPAIEYWEETKSYWEAAREQWRALFAQHSSVHVETEPMGEKKLYEQVFASAQNYADGNGDEAVKAMKATLAHSVTEASLP